VFVVYSFVIGILGAIVSALRAFLSCSRIAYLLTYTLSLSK